MHLLGGISLGLLTLWFISRSNNFKNRPNTYLLNFFAVLLVTLGVSFLWEVLEHVTGTAKAIEGYILDTTVDTSAALLGASIIAIFAARFLGAKTISDSKVNF